MYAISSAGVVHTLARACSRGELDSCSCDPRKTGSSRDARGSFEWGGCSDHVEHAVRFSQGFVDAKERKGRDARALMNLHNNRAGRKVRNVKECPLNGMSGKRVLSVRRFQNFIKLVNMNLTRSERRFAHKRFKLKDGLSNKLTSCPSPRQAVKRFMTLECKCHGVSGSCSVRTCWLAMADFRRTGDQLRRRYNGAAQVSVNQYGTGFTAAHAHFKRPSGNDLVYLEDSPDYCVWDPESGTRRRPSRGGGYAPLPLLFVIVFKGLKRRWTSNSRCVLLIDISLVALRSASLKHV